MRTRGNEAPAWGAAQVAVTVLNINCMCVRMCVVGVWVSFYIHVDNEMRRNLDSSIVGGVTGVGLCGALYREDGAGSKA